MAVQVDYRISPSDQFSVYNPDTKSNKTITYFTLLAKIRGDLNITGGGSSLPIDIVDAQDNQLLVYDSGSSTWRNETVGIFKNIRTTSSYDWEDTAFVWETVENTWETGVSSEAVVADQLEDTLYLIADSGLSITGNPITDTIVFDNIDKGSTQNIFKNIAVSGQSTIVADSNDDTLTLVGSGGVSITTNASTDTITISTTGIVDGSGTTNYVAKWTDSDTIGDSQIFDNGTNVGIGTASPAYKVDVDGGVYADYFQLDTSYSDGAIAGKFSWNPDRETAELGLNGTVSLILGQDNLWYVKNQTGTAIPKGVAVMAVGALGASSRILVAPMVADGTISSKYLIGITIEEIADGDDGFVIAQGKLRGIDTSGFTQGTVLYCDPNNAGLLTSTEPTAPDLKLPIAFTVDSKSNGTLAIRVTAGTTISEANDVQLTSPSDNDFLVYNSTSGIFENEAVGIFKTIAVSGQNDVVADSYTDTLTLVAGTNITITTDDTTDTITINSPDAGGTVTNIATTAPITGGPITTTGTIGITQSGASTDGYLSSTDWNTFNNKEPALTKGDLTESTSSILTIGNGTGAVIGSGTTITVAQSGTLTDGYLSSTDWNTFNDKEPALTKGNLTETTSAVLTITGGSNAVIGSGTTIQVSQASTSTSGYLSSVDWNTFNDKEPALTKGNLTETTSAILTITGGTNAVIGSGATIAVAQAGSTTSGYLSSTDWGTFDGKADYSFVTIAVSGQSDVVADSASDTLTLVAGSGVTITTDATGDSITIAATGSGGTVTSIATSAPLSGGPITTTGTISITQSNTSTDGYLSSTDWNTFNGKQDALTFGNLTETTSSILTITGGTGAVVGSGTTIAVTQASASTSGFLSSTDWNTFNDKEPAVTKGNLTEATSAVLTITNGTGAVIGSGTSIQVAQSGASTSGYLSSTDWTTFNGKASYAFKTIAVSGQTSIVADAADDTLTVAEGARIDITTDATNDILTVTHGTASGADFTTAQDFKDRVEADGGTFEAVGEVAVALGILEDSLPATASDNSNGVVLQNIAVDEFGHVLGYSSTDLDDRYYTETEVDALFALETLDTVTDRGATTTNSITIGGLVVDTDTLVVDSANNRVVIGGTTASYPLHVKTQVSNVSIYAEYDIAAYSDARVKEDVITISGALDKVTSMRGVTYKRIGLDSDKRFMGVIAQEVLPHAPEVVHEDEDGMYSVSYQNMVGLLIEAMKEQQQQIEELKQQLKALSK